jgi:hypothetical protein
VDFPTLGRPTITSDGSFPADIAKQYDRAIAPVQQTGIPPDATPL